MKIIVGQKRSEKENLVSIVFTESQSNMEIH